MNLGDFRFNRLSPEDQERVGIAAGMEMLAEASLVSLRGMHESQHPINQAYAAMVLMGERLALRSREQRRMRALRLGDNDRASLKTCNRT